MTLERAVEVLNKHKFHDGTHGEWEENWMWRTYGMKVVHLLYLQPNCMPVLQKLDSFSAVAVAEKLERQAKSAIALESLDRRLFLEAGGYPREDAHPTVTAAFLKAADIEAEHGGVIAGTHLASPTLVEEANAVVEILCETTKHIDSTTDYKLADCIRRLRAALAKETHSS